MAWQGLYFASRLHQLLHRLGSEKQVRVGGIILDEIHASDSIGGTLSGKREVWRGALRAFDRM